MLKTRKFKQSAIMMGSLAVVFGALSSGQDVKASRHYEEYLCAEEAKGQASAHQTPNSEKYDWRALQEFLLEMSEEEAYVWTIQSAVAPPTKKGAYTLTETVNKKQRYDAIKKIWRTRTAVCIWSDHSDLLRDFAEGKNSLYSFGGLTPKEVKETFDELPFLKHQMEVCKEYEFDRIDPTKLNLTPEDQFLLTVETSSSSSSSTGGRGSNQAPQSDYEKLLENL